MDALPVSALNLEPNTWAQLDRRPAPLPAAMQSPLMQSGGPRAEEQQRMHGRILSGLATARAHDDPAMQQAARAVCPWDELCAKADSFQPRALSASTGGGADAAAPRPSPDLEELRALLHWFKHDFFSWVDKPDCEVTGGPTQMCGMGTPTAEEQAGGASRVELYRGPGGHITRFPRYNDPSVLLRTRRGRCGEWANCFCLVARAVGFEARWVLDVTDHVWAEVYSHRQRRWLHADPCECSCDGEPAPPPPLSSSSSSCCCCCCGCCCTAAHHSATHTWYS